MKKKTKIVAKPKAAPKLKGKPVKARVAPPDAPEPEIAPDLLVIPDLYIEPDHDIDHPVVRVDLRIAPTLFAKLTKLSADERKKLNVRIVAMLAEATA